MEPNYNVGGGSHSPVQGFQQGGAAAAGGPRKRLEPKDETSKKIASFASSIANFNLELVKLQKLAPFSKLASTDFQRGLKLIVTKLVNAWKEISNLDVKDPETMDALRNAVNRSLDSFVHFMDGAIKTEEVDKPEVKEQKQEKRKVFTDKNIEILSEVAQRHGIVLDTDKKKQTASLAPMKPPEKEPEAPEAQLDVSYSEPMMRDWPQVTYEYSTITAKDIQEAAAKRDAQSKERVGTFKNNMVEFNKDYTAHNEKTSRMRSFGLGMLVGVDTVQANKLFNVLRNIYKPSEVSNYIKNPETIPDLEIREAFTKALDDFVNQPLMKKLRRLEE